MGDEREAPLTPAAHASPPSAPQVEIVSAGNEVLLGDVVDTNSNWLCKHITGLGGQVRRTVMVRDEVEAIADELRAALRRRPQLIFTVGGLASACLRQVARQALRDGRPQAAPHTVRPWNNAR